MAIMLDVEYKLENQHYVLCINDRGCITHLERKGSGYGNIISVGDTSLFRAVLKQGDNWESIVDIEALQYQGSIKGSTLVLRTDRLKAGELSADIVVELSIRLDGPNLVFGGSIKNMADSCMVTDVFFPCIGSLRTLKGGEPGLLWPECTGQWIGNIVSNLESKSDWGEPQTLSATYPGPLSMQWMSLVDGDEVLYYGGHDQLFHTSSLRVSSKIQTQERTIALERDTLAFVRFGEQWQCPEAVISLYQGSWRIGADEYASWSKTWRNPVEKTNWIKEMNGYFLVINKQQFGDEMWPYNTIPSLYKYAEGHGCDTVGLFGWYESGHDNQYPDLKVSSGLGGEEALKQGIREVQAAGGHVTLYYQGHLMDINSEYYQKTGKDLEGRNIWNNPYFEDYSKFHDSDFLKYFSKKKFSTVCPSCPEWHDLMAEKATWVASFGPDGILYDQIGGMPAYPCFNEAHPHLENRPSLSYTQGRITLLKRIHEQVRSLGSEFSFMTEHETDVYSQFPDALHGIGVCPASKKGKRPASSWTSMSSTAPEMFRYCFPETILTLRNPNPFLSPRYVNYALVYGFRFEMEIRYRADKDFLQSQEKGEWGLYAKQIASLRRKHSDVLLKGVYREMEGIQNGNKALNCSLFIGEDRRCVVLWNDTEAEQLIDLKTPGYSIEGWETLEETGTGVPKLLQSNSIILIFLHK